MPFTQEAPRYRVEWLCTHRPVWREEEPDTANVNEAISRAWEIAHHRGTQARVIDEAGQEVFSTARRRAA